MVLCTRCRRDNDDDARFCKYCGNRVGTPRPGPEEFYGSLARSSLGLMDVEELPPDVQRRRDALSRLWLMATAVVALMCIVMSFGACVPFLFGWT